MDLAGNLSRSACSRCCFPVRPGFSIYINLDENGAADISLTITGGLRISSDFAKALALGADAVAISTSVLIAIGCQQYRVCNSGKCPMGIATQDPGLRRRLDIDQAAQQYESLFSFVIQIIS